MNNIRMSFLWCLIGNDAVRASVALGNCGWGFLVCFPNSRSRFQNLAREIKSLKSVSFTPYSWLGSDSTSKQPHCCSFCWIKENIKKLSLWQACGVQPQCSPSCMRPLGFSFMHNFFCSRVCLQMCCETSVRKQIWNVFSGLMLVALSKQTRTPFRFDHITLGSSGHQALHPRRNSSQVTQRNTWDSKSLSCVLQDTLHPGLPWTVATDVDIHKKQCTLLGADWGVPGQNCHFMKGKNKIWRTFAKKTLIWKLHWMLKEKLDNVNWASCMNATFRLFAQSVFVVIFKWLSSWSMGNFLGY